MIATHRLRRYTALAFAGALVFTAGAAPAHAAGDDPAAVLVQVAGEVRVQRAGQASDFAGTVGLHLLDGDRIAVGPGGRAVVLYSTGRMETATASLVIQRPAGTQSSPLFASTVRTLVEVATTDARSQPNRQGMIRPVAGEPVAIAPRNRVTLLDPRPTFAWFAVAGIDEYLVQLRRSDGVCGDATLPPASRPAHCLPRRFAAGRDTTWTLPDSEPPLVPGASYEWVVGARGIGRVGTAMQFRIIDPDAYASLAAALHAITDGGLDPAGDGAFLAAVAYHAAGLLYEADALLARLAAAGATGATFHNLRGEVFDALGRLEDAGREFERAGAGGTP
jgi:hypothetical protein